jgi:hypothetical protein
MKSVDIELALLRLYSARVNIVVPNVSWGLFSHECDIIVCRPTGYVAEIEIKVSVADMKADLKKQHHHVDRQNRIRELYYAIPKKIYDKCIQYIPEEAGIIVVEEYYEELLKDDFYFATIKRKAKANRFARVLTDKEKLKLAHLGTMRIWNLKRKLKKSK